MEYQDLLHSGVDKIIGQEELEKRLKSGQPMRIKHGVDPTTADLHLGYSVVYHKLREFQDLGHQIIFLIGDFTGRFGDPADQTSARSMRDKDEVTELAKNYLRQVGTILDLKKTEIRHNSEWYDKMSAEQLLKLMSNFTYAGLIERDMFQERIKKSTEIWFHEMVYPILQGYDSVMLKSDMTIIGSDQLFNEMCGRRLQEKFNQAPQIIMTVPMLVGTDGKMKMSQSLGNYIGLTENAKDQFGKVMSIPDEIILNYFELVARVSGDKLVTIKKRLETENPKIIKEELAFMIVKLYHGESEAQKAKEEFESFFSKKELPEDIDEVAIKPGEKNIVDLIIEAKMADSKSEARRLVLQGGVKIDSAKVSDPQEIIAVKSGMVIQVGKLGIKKIK